MADSATQPQGDDNYGGWPLWAKVLIGLAVAAALFYPFVSLGWLIAPIVAAFVWRDWFGARRMMTAVLSSLSSASGGFLGVVTVFILWFAWAGASALQPSIPTTPTPSPLSTAVAALPAPATPKESAVNTPVPNTPTAVPEPSATPAKASAATPTAAPTKAPIPTERATATPAAPLNSIHRVGETVEVGGHTIQLTSVKPGAAMSLEMLITNSGLAKNLLKVRFDTMYLRDADGRQFAYVYPKIGGWFEGEVLPGDKLRGSVEFAVDKPVKGLRFYYRPDRYSNQSTIVFSLDDQATASPLIRPSWVDQVKPLTTGTQYRTGDSVNVGGLMVLVKSARTSGGTASFDVVMFNDKTSGVSLRLEDLYVCKDADGNQGQLKRTFNYTDTGGLPGSDIIKGDLSTGTVSFDFKQAVVGAPRLYVMDGKAAAVFQSD